VEVRQGVVQAIEAGSSYEEAAETFGVSLSLVSRFLTRLRGTGSVKPEKFGGYKGYALEEHWTRLIQWVNDRPDITLPELQARLKKEKIVVSQTAIFRFLRHLDFAFKTISDGVRASACGRRNGRGVSCWWEGAADGFLVAGTP